MENLQIKKNHMKIGGIIVVVIIAAFFFLNRGSETAGVEVLEQNSFGVREGQLATSFEFTDIEGRAQNLDGFKGKPTLFAFMATWCTPCQIEARNARRSQAQHDFNVIQLDIDQRETDAQLQTFKDDFGTDNWIMARDVGQRIANQYQVRSFDTTILLDSDGVIVFRDEGSPVSTEKLNELLSEIT